MSNSAIQVGDIVVVIHPGWRFTGKQGRVEEIIDDENQDGPIGVVFPDYYGRIIDYPYEPGNIVRFQTSDLRRVKRDHRQDITIEQICDNLFGRSMWSHIVLLDQPLMISFTDCMYRECENKAVLRIMINCHGTVSESDVCADHAHYHGKNTDDFPFKKNLQVRCQRNIVKLLRLIEQ